MSDKKFFYKYETVFDHNITEAEWNKLRMGFDFVNRDQYLRYIIKRPTSGYFDIYNLYLLRNEPEKAKKYLDSPEFELSNNWDLSL